MQGNRKLAAKVCLFFSRVKVAAQHDQCRSVPTTIDSAWAGIDDSRPDRVECNRDAGGPTICAVWPTTVDGPTITTTEYADNKSPPSVRCGPKTVSATHRPNGTTEPIVRKRRR